MLLYRTPAVKVGHMWRHSQGLRCGAAAGGTSTGDWATEPAHRAAASADTRTSAAWPQSCTEGSAEACAAPEVAAQHEPYQPTEVLAGPPMLKSSNGSRRQMSSNRIVKLNRQLRRDQWHIQD